MHTLRSYHPSDALPLLELFRDTIRRVNCRDYSPVQINAWASDEIDPVAWAERFAGRFVVVADSEGKLVGFAELEADGHIDRLYVSADHQGQGVGRSLISAIFEEAERLGLKKLFVEASITAKPFFELHGFTVISPQTVTSRGVEFLNYRMERVFFYLS